MFYISFLNNWLLLLSINLPIAAAFSWLTPAWNWFENTLIIFWFIILPSGCSFWRHRFGRFSHCNELFPQTGQISHRFKRPLNNRRARTDRFYFSSYSISYTWSNLLRGILGRNNRLRIRSWWLLIKGVRIRWFDKRLISVSNYFDDILIVSIVYQV